MNQRAEKLLGWRFAEAGARRRRRFCAWSRSVAPWRSSPPFEALACAAKPRPICPEGACCSTAAGGGIPDRRQRGAHLRRQQGAGRGGRVSRSVGAAGAAATAGVRRPAGRAGHHGGGHRPRGEQPAGGHHGQPGPAGRSPCRAGTAGRASRRGSTRATLARARARHRPRPPIASGGSWPTCAASPSCPTTERRPGRRRAGRCAGRCRARPTNSATAPAVVT